MESLWDMSRVREIPLAPQKLSTRKAPLFVKGVPDWARAGDSWVAASKTTGAEENRTASWRGDEQLVVEEWTYNSQSGENGPDCIFGALAYPEGGSRAPVLLVFHGGGGHGSSALAVAIARKNPGMAAFSMDYNGQFRPKGKHVTRWRSVTEELRKPRLQLVPDLRNFPMYHYVMAARRAIDFLESQGKFDMSRVGCFGISYGGWVALILAGIDERVKCVVNGVSAGGTRGTASRSSQPLRWRPEKQRELWLAAYDPESYATRTRAGVFLKICSNDRFFWLDGALRNYTSLAGPKRVLITPNSDHGAGGPAMPDPSFAWVRQILLGGPALPQVIPGSLTWKGEICTWKVKSPVPVTRALLYWSPGEVVSCARYWVGIKARETPNGWEARVPGRFEGLAGQVYVNVFDARGLAVSSTCVLQKGIRPQVEPAPLWAGDSLWDSERGAEAWRPLTPGGGPPTAVATAPNQGVEIGPEAGGVRFSALTNSVVLASGSARLHKGITIEIDGGGSSGILDVSLVKDSNSLDEVRTAAAVKYGPGTKKLELPWLVFRMKGGSPATPWPFNGLILEGKRPDGSPIRVGKIMFLD